MEEEKSNINQTVNKTDNNNQKTSTNPLIVCLLVFSLLFGGAGFCVGFLALKKVSTPITFLNNGSDGNSANFIEGSIADIAGKVSDSVVSIITSITSRDFFGQSYSSSAAGTGVIVSENGYILTNKHVISDATSVYVVLDDGTIYEIVEVVTTDPLNDIAFLKIKDVKDLKPATLGDSKTLSVGQQVLAIGNALGQYQNTVTSGSISGL